jgi:hypothetical protein
MWVCKDAYVSSINPAKIGEPHAFTRVLIPYSITLELVLNIGASTGLGEQIGEGGVTIQLSCWIALRNRFGRTTRLHVGSHPLFR